MTKPIILKYLTFSLIFFLSACESDCVFKHYDTLAGDTFCGKFCPLQDDQGNDVLDVDGNVIYDKPKKIDEVNCTGVSSTRTSTTTSSRGSTS